MRSLSLVCSTLLSFALSLARPAAAASKDTLAIPGQGFLDVKRTKTLWNDVFLGQQAIIRKGDWVDRPSVGIPYLYVSTGLILAEALTQAGDKPGVAKVLDTTRSLARVTRLGDIGPTPTDEPPVPLTKDTGAKTKVPVRSGDTAKK